MTTSGSATLHPAIEPYIIGLLSTHRQWHYSSGSMCAVECGVLNLATFNFCSELNWMGMLLRQAECMNWSVERQDNYSCTSDSD